MRSARSLISMVVAAAAFASLAAPAPALAQRGWEIHGRMERIAERIDRSEARGRITRREARQLREELRSIRDTELRMRNDGRLDGREREVLERRLNRLDERVSDARR